jgi:D-alanyl-lipoteichoic acid acyltransferase DltB (MBOAT superfamily)
MTIAQQNQRLLTMVIFFAILATILLAVLWFEGSQFINIFWHTVHGTASRGIALVSRRP